MSLPDAFMARTGCPTTQFQIPGAPLGIFGEPPNNYPQ